MRYYMLAATLLIGCGSAPAPLDLASPVVLDFAAPVEDLAQPAPPDLAFSICTAPQPGIYNELLFYNYTLAGGGTAMGANSQTAVIVKNDGSFVRPSTTFATPTLYHCSFTAVDSTTCLAPCCPGQTASPVMYFDKGGWTFWVGGACAFQTTTGAQYIANITDVEGFFVR